MALEDLTTASSPQAPSANLSVITDGPFSLEK